MSGCAPRVNSDGQIRTRILECLHFVLLCSAVLAYDRESRKFLCQSNIKPHVPTTMAATIPRFLLPQQSSIWRTRIASSSRAVQTVRNASHKAPSKAKAAPKVPVLEKPTKFNPPSHGAKLKKELPRHYGSTLSAAQKAAQQTKKYPNMMPAEGTFMHWFLNNRSIHIYITLVLTP